MHPDVKGVDNHRGHHRQKPRRPSSETTVDIIATTDTTTDDPTTDNTAADGTAVDLWLFRAIGLYRALCPAERGGYGPRARRAFVALTYWSVCYSLLQCAWLHATVHDVQRTVYTVWQLTFNVTVALKGRALFEHAPRLWALLDSARIAYTACGARRPAAMHRCRRTVRRLLRPFVALLCAALAMWAIPPLVRPTAVTVVLADGTVARYRATLFSVWFPLPERAHNSPAGWAVLYALELLSFWVGLPGFIWFDCYLITMCFALEAQFRTVCECYETLGSDAAAAVQASPSSDGRPGDFHNTSNESTRTDHYSDLMKYIQANQSIMKMFDEFGDIMKTLVTVHIVTCSFSVISFIFFVCLVVVTNQPMDTLFFKLVCSLISLIIQLFVYCYAFNLTEAAKSSLQFGLYCSNWTEMDFKMKNIIFQAMVINSAHKRTMKITTTHQINLILFFRVMKTSFSVIPVLLKFSS